MIKAQGYFSSDKLKEIFACIRQTPEEKRDMIGQLILDMFTDTDPMSIDKPEEFSMFADEEYEALQNALIERHRQRLASKDFMTVDSLTPYDELKWIPKVWTGSD